MQRETYRNLLTEALKHVADGEGNVLVDNPAKTFTERAEKGDFIYTLDDMQYMQALADVNDLSKRIWDMKECQSWYFILEKVLNIKKLHTGVITRVVQTLAVYCEDKLDEQKEDYIYDPIYNVIDYDLIAQKLNIIYTYLTNSTSVQPPCTAVQERTIPCLSKTNYSNLSKVMEKSFTQRMRRITDQNSVSRLTT